MKRYIIALIAAMTLTTAYPANTLRGRNATISAPDGLSYDATLSQKMNLDVYIDKNRELIFALGSQPADESFSPAAISVLLAQSMGIDADGKGAIHAVLTDDGLTLNAVTSPTGDRTIAFTAAPVDGRITLVMIIGKIETSHSMSYLRTLHITAKSL